MILMIDHFDSFTYNVYQAVAEMGKDIEVVRYGVLSVEEIIEKQPEAIILSPGPGRPEDSPESIRLIEEAHKSIPILGICLGHQMIGSAFGGKVIHAPVIRHGKVSEVAHGNKGIFSDVGEPLPVMRYHSLVIEAESLPECFEVHARSTDDGTVMAVKHKDYPVYGMQFHPESIGTPDGDKLIEGFFHLIGKETASH